MRPWGITVSVSMGIAAFEPRVDHSLDAVLARADAAAYEAKRLGGDGIATAPARSPER
ncbi:MAG TPA: diguanylate cyclase [Vicinamibacteria bacterium]|nr:diguanylate cyclase [Vicinamibacteria bacterium]